MNATLKDQPMRWKGRWVDALTGLYDVRARQWAPPIGVFLQIDEYKFHDPQGTLWSWPRLNPVRFGDPTGRSAPTPIPPPNPCEPSNPHKPIFCTHQKGVDSGECGGPGGKYITCTYKCDDKTEKKSSQYVTTCTEGGKVDAD